MWMRMIGGDQENEGEGWRADLLHVEAAVVQLDWQRLS
jgi:hypothetical protein